MAREIVHTTVCSVETSDIQYNTIQYKFYCQLPMGAFQRQEICLFRHKQASASTSFTVINLTVSHKIDMVN